VRFADIIEATDVVNLKVFNLCFVNLIKPTGINNQIQRWIRSYGPTYYICTCT